MPTISRPHMSDELERLISIFLKAETDIINEIARLREGGLVDYHAQAALDRVQGILRKLENDSWEYVPKMIERQFYVQHPEARAFYESVKKHAAGYSNAEALTSTQMDIVQQLVTNLMGEITEATVTVGASLEAMLIGRTTPDIFRTVGLEQVASMEATGTGPLRMTRQFVEALRREGVTAFVDKAGRHWSLHTYGSMVLRTTSRQAEVLSVLTRDPEQDLYQISSHNTTCKLCAPYEGRVYSASGTDPDFPPLADAFGKMDPAGPNSLANSWLNIHPNCLHVLVPWTAAGRTPEEIQRIKDFSNPASNPYSVDPRSQKQIDAYRKKETARRQWLETYRQWEDYRLAIPEATPKTFATFQKHKLAGDDKYKEWVQKYKEVTSSDIP